MTNNQQPIRHELLPKRPPKAAFASPSKARRVRSRLRWPKHLQQLGGRCRPHDRVGAATWQTTVKASPGRHHYKFVVNGSDWIRDPANPWVSEDAQNNSCFHAQRVRRRVRAHRRSVAADPGRSVSPPHGRGQPAVAGQRRDLPAVGARLWRHLRGRARASATCRNWAYRSSG
ncbi:glycogen-binding domain-containing protein [Massilia sp. H-1]|nr:glycogen-binding domain-containing protein [Massilia sp. H-1]